MDKCEYSTLGAAWADIPDQRKARGKQHAWVVMLSLIAAAMGNGAILNQVAVDDKSNEITAVPQLLANRDLRGTVTTVERAGYHQPTASGFDRWVDLR